MLTINDFNFSGQAVSDAERKQGQKSAYVQITVEQQSGGGRSAVLTFVVFGSSLIEKTAAVKRGDTVTVNGRLSSIVRESNGRQFYNPTFDVKDVTVAAAAKADGLPF